MGPNRVPHRRMVTKPTAIRLRITTITIIIAIMVVLMAVALAMGHRRATVIRMATTAAAVRLSSIRTMFSGRPSRCPYCQICRYFPIIHPLLHRHFNNFLNPIIQVAYLTPAVAKMACSRWIPTTRRSCSDNSRSIMHPVALVDHPAAAVAFWAEAVVAWPHTPVVIPVPIVITNLRHNIKIRIPTIAKPSRMPTAVPRLVAHPEFGN